MILYRMVSDRTLENAQHQSSWYKADILVARLHAPLAAHERVQRGYPRTRGLRSGLVRDDGPEADHARGLSSPVVTSPEVGSRLRCRRR